MDIERLDARAIEKVSGPSWDEMRPVFAHICEVLLAASPESRGELTTIYVKFAGPETRNQPYAVVWIKKASEITIGLSLPDDVKSPDFVEEPRGCRYAGLTRYLVLRRGDKVPESLDEWVTQAHEHAKR